MKKKCQFLMPLGMKWSVPFSHIFPATCAPWLVLNNGILAPLISKFVFIFCFVVSKTQSIQNHKYYEIFFFKERNWGQASPYFLLLLNQKNIYYMKKVRKWKLSQLDLR